jgi:hypothetical protein
MNIIVRDPSIREKTKDRRRAGAGRIGAAPDGRYLPA